LSEFSFLENPSKEITARRNSVGFFTQLLIRVSCEQKSFKQWYVFEYSLGEERNTAARRLISSIRITFEFTRRKALWLIIRAKHYNPSGTSK